MDAIRLETTVQHDGRIIVPGVKVGESVEVIVLRKTSPAKGYPLRKTRGVYPNPFDAAIPDSDWEKPS